MGSIVVQTMFQGTLLLEAHTDLMKKKLEFKPKRWPNLYREIKAGDYISFEWGRNLKTGKNIMEFVGIKKRGG